MTCNTKYLALMLISILYLVYGHSLSSKNNMLDLFLRNSSNSLLDLSMMHKNHKEHRSCVVIVLRKCSGAKLTKLLW
jgi:hypothetical protein